MNNRKSKLITFEDSSSVPSELFKSLRTNIRLGLKTTNKTLLVSSASPGDGKSFVCSNIAVSFAQAGFKVLILDLDLRKKSQDRIFGIRNKNGMSMLLDKSNYIDGLDLGDILPRYVNKTFVKNLDLITSGPIPHNPSEILMNENIGKLLYYLKKEYDYVFVDTPPVNVVTDTLIISKFVDTTILVASIEKTKIKFLKDAKKIFDKNNINLLGIVANRVPINKRSYKYRGYGQKYRYMENLPVEMKKRTGSIRV